MPFEATHRYPSNVAALPNKSARMAGKILEKAMRRQSAWRMAWALIEAKAKAGDHEAADLMLFVDSGGAA
ncbi:hypothetical protein UFOVP836_9 [uncultured Caudovirales phage]|uniref:Uncharacterized protein n=1 Tax=uncultured Caudovirales phage TaxID=2100421 RepID=A0A6J5PEI4_9CAUD|nr:hypothetical protein UFOVP836_9 [uncultured Caudovirales phage]